MVRRFISIDNGLWKEASPCKNAIEAYSACLTAAWLQPSRKVDFKIYVDGLKVWPPPRKRPMARAASEPLTTAQQA